MTATAKFSAPASNEYDEYYQQYVDLFQPADFLTAFRQQPRQLAERLGDLPDGVVSQLHEPYTWSIKQVVGHLIDCERIFSTRALRIGVGDKTPLPGIDQNIYVDNLDYHSVGINDLLDELQCLRDANVLLADRMGVGNLERGGVASDCYVTAKANFFILGGHFVYHDRIIEKRLAG